MRRDDPGGGVLNRNAPAKTGPSLSALERAYLNTGADLANALVAMIDRVTAPGYSIVKTGIPTLDQAITIAPRTVTVLAARPSHGKSMLLKVFARSVLDDIEARGDAAASERVVYITLEESKEKLAAQIGGFPYSWRDLQRGEIKPADVPAARMSAIGVAKTLRHMVALDNPGLVEGHLAPAITPAGVIRYVERAAIEDGIKPKAIFLDYLQLLNPDGPDNARQSRTDLVSAASKGAKRLAAAFDCPVIMAVQAGREVDGRKDKIPQMSDLQWASSIEQDADTVLGLRRPCIDHTEGAETVELGGREISITTQLMISRVIKSRDDGAGGRMFALNVDPISFKAWPVDPGYMGGPSVSSRPGYLPPAPIDQHDAADGETW